MSLLRKTDELLYENFHRFRIEDYLNPINRLEEKDKFMSAWTKGETYHPTFEYKPLPSKLAAMSAALDQLEFDESPASKMYQTTAEDFRFQIELLKLRGTHDFTALLLDQCGAPSPELLDYIKLTFKKDSRAKRPPEVGIKALCESIRNDLREDRIEGWEISEDPHCVDLTELDVFHRKIRLQPGMIISKKTMRRLRYRLIQVLLYRVLNGERQSYKMFRVGFHRSWITDQALVLHFENAGLFSDAETLRLQAGKYWATSLAMHHSFYGVFSKLENHFDAETAYSLTESVKRGLVHTSETGGWIRDHTCFLEQKKISQLNVEDLNWLYTGRVSVDHLNIVKDMVSNEELLVPAFLPK